jgi:hypothetical protein
LKPGSDPISERRISERLLTGGDGAGGRKPERNRTSFFLWTSPRAVFKERFYVTLTQNPFPRALSPLFTP